MIRPMTYRKRGRARCVQIQIYSQGEYPDAEYARDGSSLADNGCGLFTLNHAMQWVGMSDVSLTVLTILGIGVFITFCKINDGM